MAENEGTGAGAGTEGAEGTQGTEEGAQGTPEALGDGGKRALAAERKLRVEAEKRATAATTRAQELEDAQKTEAQRDKDRAEKAEKEAAEASAKLLRLEVASEKGLTARQAARLSGTTREELEADADAYLAEVGTKGTPSFDGGARKPAPAPADMNSLIRQRAGY